MIKLLNKCLRTKGLRFYLVDAKNEKNWYFDIDNPENIRYLTKVKTKKRMKELTKSVRFMEEISSIYTNWQKTYCVIVRKPNIKENLT